MSQPAGAASQSRAPCAALPRHLLLQSSIRCTPACRCDRRLNTSARSHAARSVAAAFLSALMLWRAVASRLTSACPHCCSLLARGLCPTRSMCAASCSLQLRVTAPHAGSCMHRRAASRCAVPRLSRHERRCCCRGRHTPVDASESTRKRSALRSPPLRAPRCDPHRTWASTICTTWPTEAESNCLLRRVGDLDCTVAAHSATGSGFISTAVGVQSARGCDATTVQLLCASGCGGRVRRGAVQRVCACVCAASVCDCRGAQEGSEQSQRAAQPGPSGAATPPPASSLPAQLDCRSLPLRTDCRNSSA